jgi:hypothetical protein
MATSHNQPDYVLPTSGPAGEPLTEIGESYFGESYNVNHTTISRLYGDGVGKLFTNEFKQSQWAVVTSAPWVIIPLLLFVAFLGSTIKGWLDSREIRGLRGKRRTEGRQERG